MASPALDRMNPLTAAMARVASANRESGARAGSGVVLEASPGMPPAGDPVSPSSYESLDAEYEKEIEYMKRHGLIKGVPGDIAAVDARSREEVEVPEITPPKPVASGGMMSFSKVVGFDLSGDFATVVVDTGEKFTLMPEETQELKRFALQAVARGVQFKLASMASSMGLITTPAPETPGDEGVREVPGDKTGDGVPPAPGA